MSNIKLEILAYEPSPLGILCLRRREMLSQPGTIVTEVTLDHEFLMSSLHNDSERVLATHAVEMHGGDNLRVLVGGLGLGYTAHAALESDKVSAVKVVELLPQVVDWLSSGMIPLSEELTNEPRFSVTVGDAYALLAGPPAERYDVILIDVDHSPDERLGTKQDGFYSEAGLTAARRHLSDNGVLAVWSYAASSPFADALHSVFDEVVVREVTYENLHVQESCTDWLFFAK